MGIERSRGRGLLVPLKMSPFLFPIDFYQKSRIKPSKVNHDHEPLIQQGFFFIGKPYFVLQEFVNSHSMSSEKVAL